MNHEVNANIHKIPFTLSLFYYFTETSALPPFAGGGIYSGFRIPRGRGGTPSPLRGTLRYVCSRVAKAKLSRPRP